MQWSSVNHLMFELLNKTKDKKDVCTFYAKQIQTSLNELLISLKSSQMLNKSIKQKFKRYHTA